MCGDSKLLRTCGDFFKTGLRNCRTLQNEARSATLKAFDAVALQWLSLRFQIRRTFASRFAIVCGQLKWVRPMMFSQLLEICRQLVESRTVIADTCQNSASISCHIVATRTLLVATRQNSASISCYIVATRSYSYTNRRNSCYVAVFGKAPRMHEKQRH